MTRKKRSLPILRETSSTIAKSSPCVHGSNLSQKEHHPKKYKDILSKEYLAEIRVEYDKWNAANSELKGPFAKPSLNLQDDQSIILRRTQLFENYKRFIDHKKYAEKFDSRSNLHSSALEEFIYYLFRDLVESFGTDALIGKSHTFKDLFFVPPRYSDMLKRPGGLIETKDHDFVIGATVWATLTSSSPNNSSNMQSPLSLTVDDRSESEKLYVVNSQPESSVETDEDEVHELESGLAIQTPIAADENNELHRFDIPAVAIECKTYLDKTMLESSARSAEELKARNPNGIYIVVMERIKLTERVNLRKYKLDQIYVLRKQKNKDREFRHLDTYEYKPIDPEVVWHLFNFVREFLTRDWETGIDLGIERGYLL